MIKTITSPFWQWVLRRMGFQGWASLWGVAYVLPEATEKVHRHELHHLCQMQRDGKVWFMVRYIAWFLRHGYRNHPYEIEARAVAAQYS